MSVGLESIATFIGYCVLIVAAFCLLAGAFFAVAIAWSLAADRLTREGRKTWRIARFAWIGYRHSKRYVTTFDGKKRVIYN